MIPALATVFSKLDGLRRFLGPFLPAPLSSSLYTTARAGRGQDRGCTMGEWGSPLDR
jgi:hypothetical protein